ncbi:MAG: molybdopterin molybdotransferase MoeA [Chloroflexi bacterium]|nr:molybdopterin molybdotransferase MoeA [Chloroflexota bacterium]
MISVEEALAKILAVVPVLDAEENPLLECLGQVLAEDVAAPVNVPAMDNSSMDGYAVRAEDIRGAAPATSSVLTVIGETPAGKVPDQEVLPGTAVRIMTGAPLPAGADAVVPFESTDEEQQRAAGSGRIGRIAVLKELRPGANIRRAGEDIRQGQVVLKAGTLLRPAEIGVLASLGKQRARVIRRPVVAVLATGDELLEPGEPLAPAKIYNSNAYSLAAQIARYGGIPKVLGIARDTVEDLTEKIRRGMDSDMLLTSAGVSRGDYDIVKDVLARHGEIAFWTIRMRPGKPMAFGLLESRQPDGSVRKVPHLGLPGNPVSSMVTFELYARPAILKMLGRSAPARPSVLATLRGRLVNTDGRRVYARVVVTQDEERFIARPTSDQSSGVLTSMALANGLAIVPENRPAVGDGETVEVQMLDWSREPWA